ncbi:hypothetical protein NDU88_005542 [Pleurodeles waltl]|uniref:Uncharacterized protein n=1 Tax=Pleurodeles waltl TaxID=8319 RepID=A0AAV7SM03_PLEWA|nr:hypothetical protein NDU88_005542 [Pleurodeles waltl]
MWLFRGLDLLWQLEEGEGQAASGRAGARPAQNAYPQCLSDPKMQALCEAGLGPRRFRSRGTLLEGVEADPSTEALDCVALDPSRAMVAWGPPQDIQKMTQQCWKGGKWERPDEVYGVVGPGHNAPPPPQWGICRLLPSCLPPLREQLDTSQSMKISGASRGRQIG